jgi:predicted secreted protein
MIEAPPPRGEGETGAMMKYSSMLAIYLLFWWGSLFLVLPFRLRRDMEDEAHVPGQADSAPPRFSVGRTVLWTTIVSAGAFVLFYVNYVNGWITADVFDLSRWRS